MKNHLILSLYIIILLVFVTCQGKKQKVITFKENGSWCWFQDERTIIYNNQLIIGSVADRYGKNGERLDGNIEVTSYDLKTGTHTGTFVLHKKLQADDHNAPGFLELENSRLLSVYCGHNLDSLIRYRISKKSNALDWETEKAVKGTGLR